jgi:hypothetical protein
MNVYYCLEHTIAWAIKCRSLAVGPQVQSWVTVIYDGCSGSVPESSLSSIIFPLLILIPPLLHTHLSPPLTRHHSIISSFSNFSVCILLYVMICHILAINTTVKANQSNCLYYFYLITVTCFGLQEVSLNTSHIIEIS